MTQWIAGVPRRLLPIPVLALLFLLITPFQEAYLGVLIGFLVVLLINIGPVRQLERDAWWPLLLAALLFVPLLISAPTAYDAEATFNDVLRALFFGLLAVTITLWFARPDSRPGRWLMATAAVMVFWIADGLLQYFTGSNILGFPMRSNRLTGLFYPGISIGTTIAHASPILMEVIRRWALKGGRHQLAWLLIVPMVAVIVLGGSRSSWIDFVLVTGLYVLFLLLRGIISWRWVFGLGASVVAAVILFYFVSPEFNARVAQTLPLFSGDYEAMNSATANRFPVWADAWYAFTQHPITGFGSGAFQNYVRDNNLPSPGFKYAHFFVLDVLMMTGLVGLVGYIGFYGILCWHLFTAIRNGWNLTAVLLICAVIMAFPANTHWGFYHYRPAGLMWWFIVMGYAFRYYESRHALADRTARNES